MPSPQFAPIPTAVDPPLSFTVGSVLFSAKARDVYNIATATTLAFMQILRIVPPRLR